MAFQADRRDLFGEAAVDSEAGVAGQDHESLESRPAKRQGALQINVHGVDARLQIEGFGLSRHNQIPWLQYDGAPLDVAFATPRSVQIHTTATKWTPMAAHFGSANASRSLDMAALSLQT